MSKLTKAELRIQNQVNQLLYSDSKLSYQDKEFIYTNFHPGSISDISKDSAYFTPLDMAYDFGLFAGKYGVCVDMCAGIGALTFASRARDYCEKRIKHSICIERNPKFVEIGKRLLPHATWIEGDIFDKTIWDNIVNQYGKINCIYSNPPFGKVTNTTVNRDWLKYKGAEIDMSAIDIAFTMCKGSISMILPTGSCEFQYSGRPYFKEVENRKVSKLRKEIDTDFQMTNPGLDTSVYDDFKGTKIRVEYVDLERVRKREGKMWYTFQYPL